MSNEKRLQPTLLCRRALCLAEIPPRPVLKYSYASNPGVDKPRAQPELEATLKQLRQLDFPLSSAAALQECRQLLSLRDRAEIMQFGTVYCLGLKAQKPAYVDAAGFYQASPGDHLAYRYEVVKALGRGTFAQVYECFDHRLQDLVAVKVLHKASERLGIAEINAYEGLQLEEESLHIAKMHDHFVFRGHLCIVVDLLGQSLYEFTLTQYSLTTLKPLRQITYQMLEALQHIHACGMAHADLRPENVLFTDDSWSEVNLIDFGAAVTFDQSRPSQVQTLEYRAPEVVLGCGYDSRIDLWSLACVLFELHTGRVLFNARSETELVEQMVCLLGPPPQSLVRKTRRFLTVVRQPAEGGILAKCLEDLDAALADFLQRLLRWEPKDRLSVGEALHHPWVRSR